MKCLTLLAFLLVACSSSTDPTPSAAGQDASDAAASFEGGVCGATGAACGDPITTPCCSLACVIGPLGDFTCQ